MDLKKFIAAHKEPLTVWAEWQGVGFELEFTDRTTLQGMLEQSKDLSFNPRTHQREESFSDEKFNRALAGRVKNWRLTLADLARLTSIRLNGDDPATEIPCHRENVATLINEVMGLNTWLRDSLINLDQFETARQEADIKNLPTTQG